jgi:type II secretion system protein L
MTDIIHLHQLSDLHAGMSPPEPRRDVILLVPAQLCSAFSLDVSAIPRRYLAQALPALLEEQVVEDLAALQVAQGPLTAAAELPVLVTQTARLQEWLDAARISGLQPQMICPDFYALPEQAAVSLRICAGYAIARTGPHSGISGDVAPVLALLQRLAPTAITAASDDPAALLPLRQCCALEEVALLPLTEIYGAPISLLQGAFSVKVRSQPRLRPLLGVCLLGLSALLLTVVCGRVLSTYYTAETARLARAVAAADTDLLGSASAGPEARHYLQTVAAAYLEQGGETARLLLVHINSLLAGCGGCQVESLSSDDSRALLTLREEGSAGLERQLADTPTLRLLSQQSREGMRVLEIGWSAGQ